MDIDDDFTFEDSSLMEISAISEASLFVSTSTGALTYIHSWYPITCIIINKINMKIKTKWHFMLANAMFT